MKRLLFLSAALFTISQLDAYKLTVVNDTAVGVQVNMHYQVCRQDSFALAAGASKTVNSGACILSGIEANTLDDVSAKRCTSGNPSNSWSGKYEGPFAGDGKFYIFSGESKKKLAIVRDNALKTYLK